MALSPERRKQLRAEAREQNAQAKVRGERMYAQVQQTIREALLLVDPWRKPQ